MTTKAQVRRLLKPLLERHGDVALVDGWAVVGPVNHIARGVLIDRTSSKNELRPRWSIIHTFEPLQSFHVTLGQLIYRPQKGLWQWTDEEMPNALLPIVESEVLPMLRNMDTLEKYVTFIRQHPNFGWNKRPLQKLIVDVAMGDFDAKRDLPGCDFALHAGDLSG